MRVTVSVASDDAEIIRSIDLPDDLSDVMVTRESFRVVGLFTDLYHTMKEAACSETKDDTEETSGTPASSGSPASGSPSSPSSE